MDDDGIKITRVPLTEAQREALSTNGATIPRSEERMLRECRRIVFGALLWFHAGIVGVVLFELVIRRWFWP